MPRLVRPPSGRKPRADLSSFVEGMSAPSKLLGLTHMTDAYTLRDIIEDSTIGASEPCPVLHEVVTYSFYGRVGYRGANDSTPSNLACSFPTVFIFDPLKVPKPKYVFSFDSGAYVSGLMDDYTHKHMPLCDFMLSPTPVAAAKLINEVFATADDYLDNRPRSDFVVPASNFEADCYKKLVLSGGQGQIRLDDRLSTPEIVFADRIDLQSSVVAVILPDTLECDPLIGGKLNILNVPTLPYSFISCSRPGECLLQIRGLVRAVYSSRGWL